MGMAKVFVLLLILKGTHLNEVAFMHLHYACCL